MTTIQEAQAKMTDAIAPTAVEPPIAEAPRAVGGLAWRSILASVFISSLITALAFGSYERLVRVPRTPRLGVVDVTRLVQLGRKKVESVLVSSTSTDQERAQALAASSDFAEKLRTTMIEVGTECQCTLVGLPGVYGDQAGAMDLTDTIRDRLGV